MSDTGWGIVFLLGIITAIALVLSISIWQVFRTQQAKAISNVAFTQDGAYRALATETSAAIRKSADEQERMAAELTDLRTRVTAMERMLKEVG